MIDRFDPRRAPIALLAAAIALSGALAEVSSNSTGNAPLAPVGACVFGLEALVAGLLAVVPSGGRWPDGRRAVAGLVAGLGLFAMPVLFLMEVRTACACSNSGPPGITFPVPFGLDPLIWVAVVAVAFPALIAITTATALDRIGRGTGA